MRSSPSTNQKTPFAKPSPPRPRKGIDVVIDYLWGRPTELLLEALPRDLHPARAFHAPGGSGESAGKTITLPGATLRSIDLKLMGSGFGAVPLEQSLKPFPALFSMAAAGDLRVAIRPVPLAEVESAWKRKESGRRIVFTL